MVNAWLVQVDVHGLCTWYGAWLMHGWYKLMYMVDVHGMVQVDVHG
jgi:hypothetical protein